MTQSANGKGADRLRDYWYPVALSSDVQDKPVGVVLLGVDVVLWRTDQGIFAFKDVCIHRGTRLSLGWIDGGQLVCPYHGWCYRSDGAVTRIPAIPPERHIPPKARAEKYCCADGELGGLALQERGGMGEDL